MSHYALVDANNIVVKVIVADQEFIDKFAEKPEGSRWIQTSYNTHGGKHIHPETGEINTKPPLRKNFAGRGFTYDEKRDAFIPPKPEEECTFNEETCSWDFSKKEK